MSRFDNENRTRYYGLRISDIVKVPFYKLEKATVIEYGFLDNNRVYIQTENDEKISCVAEFCEIITKVEDI